MSVEFSCLCLHSYAQSCNCIRVNLTMSIQIVRAKTQPFQIFNWRIFYSSYTLISYMSLVTKKCHTRHYGKCVPAHVGKYDRADDRPKLAMLTANVGYPILDRWSIEAWMIIAGLYWLIILTPKSLPMIGRESLPELSRRSFKFIMILIMTIKFKT